ncbi:Protein NPGR2 [Zea mays]|uniref:Protein NPGR2 n=1 Tax=Zea mays TaxID=4577 RepID=A0A3L6EV94_MAIZE|nr:Protein NPGR2 [Zea mays]
MPELAVLALSHALFHVAPPLPLSLPVFSVALSRLSHADAGATARDPSPVVSLLQVSRLVAFSDLPTKLYITPNLGSCNILLVVLVCVGDPNSALKSAKAMYRVLIGEYCHRRKLQDAARIMDEMEAAGEQPIESRMDGRKRKGKFRNSLRRMAMECLCSGEQLKASDETMRSSDSTITKDFSASGYSSRNGEIEQYLDNGNIEEAELSLREGICLNYEEARALLGRLEYQRGHVEAALRVFDGIDISALVPKMKLLEKQVVRRLILSGIPHQCPCMLSAFSWRPYILKQEHFMILGKIKA